MFIKWQINWKIKNSSISLKYKRSSGSIWKKTSDVIKYERESVNVCSRMTFFPNTVNYKYLRFCFVKNSFYLIILTFVL